MGEEQGLLPVTHPDRQRIKVVSKRLLRQLREVARQDGWALAVHGSMSRDLDLVAVPWTDSASYEPSLVEALRAAVARELGGKAFIGAGEDGRNPGYKVKPNGRRCYTLHSTSEQLVENEAGAHPYVDLSILDFRLSAVGHAFGDGVYAACSALEDSDRRADDLIASAWPDYADQYAALLPAAPTSAPTARTSNHALLEALGQPEDWAEKLAELYTWTGSAWVSGDEGAERPAGLSTFLCSLIGYLVAGEDAARAAITQAETGAVGGASEGAIPAGYALVPVEKLRDWYTQAVVMSVEAVSDDDDDHDERPTPRLIVEMEAMLFAAPASPSADRIKRETVEACARVADKHAEDALSELTKWKAEEVAKSIRALSDAPAAEQAGGGK